MIQITIRQIIFLFLAGFITGGAIGVVLGTIRSSNHYCDLIDELRQKLMEVYK